MKKYLHTADILLPDFENVDGTKWATIACDQFTSEGEYWDNAESIVGDAPSALRVILPEIYLNQRNERVKKINDTMLDYEKSVLISHKNSMIYLERTDSQGNLRRGLVGCIDLEDYDYAVGAKPLIRATEGTVLERIPPRQEVRKNASIELPHVMLLIDDEKKEIIEKCTEMKGNFARAYDFPLMLGGGHVKGYFMTEEAIEYVQGGIEKLAENGGDNPLLFAVGDGNHSLATAKAHYESIKAQYGDKAKEMAARYALCEVVNIHDASLEFEPIYRVVFGVDANEMLTELSAYAEKIFKSGDCSEYPAQCVHYIHKDGEGDIKFACGSHSLTVGTLQKFLDEYVRTHAECEVDYIHGVDSLTSLARRDNAIGFLFDGMEKKDLFPAVERDGALPRKTFSMGEARDKRYYIESRKIL